VILPISAFQVAGITDMSHCFLSSCLLFTFSLFLSRFFGGLLLLFIFSDEFYHFSLSLLQSQVDPAPHILPWQMSTEVQLSSPPPSARVVKPSPWQLHPSSRILLRSHPGAPHVTSRRQGILLQCLNRCAYDFHKEMLLAVVLLMLKAWPKPLIQY
jgi:hypothetical protein